MRALRRKVNPFCQSVMCQRLMPSMCRIRDLPTIKSLINISPFQCPDSSNKCLPEFISEMNPPIALYVPPKYPLVLNSMSAIRPLSGHRMNAWSPNSYFILPNRMPRAYMLGCVIKLARISGLSVMNSMFLTISHFYSVASRWLCLPSCLPLNCPRTCSSVSASRLFEYDVPVP